MKFIARSRLGVLCPDDAAGRAAMQKLGDGAVVTVEVRKPRSPRSLNWYWALLQKLAETQDVIPTKELMHKVLKVETGLCQVFIWNGKAIVQEESVSFDRMTEDEWRQYLDAAVRVICTKIIPGMDEGELRREVEEMVGSRVAA